MNEVEVKVRLGPGDSDRLRERLRRAGALRGDLEVQRDTYFAHPGRDFAATDEALRLRSTAAGLELTYKGPRAGTSGVKSRQEESVRLREDPTALLAGLGYKPVFEVRKRRESWGIGGVTVVLDTVDGLGDFAEIEVVSDDAKDAARRVEAAVKDLGLERAQRIAQSYLEMLHNA